MIINDKRIESNLQTIGQSNKLEMLISFLFKGIIFGLFTIEYFFGFFGFEFEYSFI